MNFNFIQLVTRPLNINTIVGNIINLVLIIVALVAFAYFLYGGFLFITSGGDAEKVGTARNTLLYAIIGIIVVVFSYAIVYFVGTYFTNPVK